MYTKDREGLWGATFGSLAQFEERQYLKKVAANIFQIAERKQRQRVCLI